MIFFIDKQMIDKNDFINKNLTKPSSMPVLALIFSVTILI